MPTFRTTRQVKHSPEKMFALVADIEQYPRFVPFCTGLKIKRRQETPDGMEVLIAEMSVGYRMLVERFTSRVTLNRAKNQILVEYIDGPFRKLQNTWTFLPGEPEGESCKVEFFIDYEFKSRTLAVLMGAMFETYFRKSSAAFEERADLIYGV